MAYCWVFEICFFSWVGVFFFFQAEDGIRDIGVTGVQTCALPICEGGGVGRRPPPALELARVRPQLPDALDRCIEFGLHGQGEPLGILADGSYGHRFFAFVSTVSMAPAVSAMSSSMRSMRARHSSSYWSSRRRATSSASRLVRTTLRRPMRCFVIRPARSRTATCFWTAAKLMG